MSKPKIRNRSVRHVLQRIVMFTTTTALLIACVCLVIVDFFRERRALEADLTSLAEIVGSNSTAAMLFGDQEAARDILHALSARRSIVSAGLHRKDGRAFALYPDSTAERRKPRLGVIEITRPILLRGEVVGTISIASDLSDVVVGIRHEVVMALLVVLGTMALASAISSRMQRVIADPVLDLTRFADRVRTEKNYSLRAHRSAGAVQEIDLLTSAFDEMLAVVQQRDSHLEEQVEARTGELARARDEAERLGRHQEAVLNTAGEGIFGLDANGVATFINVSAARMLGYSVEELIGRRLHDVIHLADGRTATPEECRVCSASIEPSLRTGANVAFLTSGGRAFPVEYTANRMDGSTGQAGVVVTFRDVTERLAIERMKDEFVSTVSHELRTPLTSIHGALGLVASGLAGELPPRVQRMLTIAVTNTDRLGRLINDILDLEKMSSGRVDLQRALASTRSIVDDAINGVQAVADHANIRVTRDETDAVLWLDRDRIIQTLTNLIGNAIKFSPAGSAVHVSGAIDDGLFTFAVSDKGRGIPAAKLETVFERFQQVDASDSRDKGGTGLGLAICRSIVSAHGGTIWVDSVEGQGSTFRFTIPIDVANARTRDRQTSVVLVSAAGSEREREIVEALETMGSTTRVVRTIDDAIAQPAPSAFVIEGACDASSLQRIAPVVIAPENAEDVSASVATAINTRWVLLVEDDEDLSGVTATALEDSGLRTIVARSGSIAMQCCGGAAPTAIIVDLGLPDIDGFAVVEWMRRQQRLRDVPVFVYSAREIDASESSRLQLGPTQFLLKSRDPLSEVIERVAVVFEESAKEVRGAA